MPKKGLLVGLTLLMIVLPILPASAQADIAIHPWLTDVELSFPVENAIIRNGRTLVPIRELGESLGCKIDYSNGKITVTKNDTIIEFSINKEEALVNGRKTSIDVAPILINGKCYLPLRFIATSLNLNIKYYHYPEINYTFIMLADHTLISDEEVDYEIRHNFVLDPYNDFWMDTYYLKEGKTTKRGIGIGSTVEEVLKAYGKPGKVEHFEDGFSIYHYVSSFYIESEFSGLSISTNNGIVNWISLTN